MIKGLRGMRLFSWLIMLVLLVETFSINVYASSTQITGKSNCSQTVYAGSSSSYYTTIGSIGKGEKVYILGKEKGIGWYHIQYYAGSKQKSGYVPTSTIVSIQGGTPHEESFYGGFAISNSSQTVWSCDDKSIATSIGSISANEGVTQLYSYSNNGVRVTYIEYSTSSGAKIWILCCRW